jgi:small subunit ribosomal protein S16
MAVKIRLARRGRKQMPIYDIVVADARSPRDGKFIEKLGQYNPHSTPAGIVLKADRALYWLTVGAQPTDTTRKVLSVSGVMFRRHVQIGVEKGAITQEQADAKYDAWMAKKEAARAQKIAKLGDTKAIAKKAAFDAETKKKEDKAAAIAKAEADMIAAAEAAENPVAEVAEVAEAQVEEVATEVTEAATEVVEATEAPVAEVEEEVVAEVQEVVAEVQEVVAEAPNAAAEVIAEVVEAPVAEEAPAAESTEETPAAE